MAEHFPRGNLHDPSLHLFLDDYHVRNVFAMKRTFGRPRKLEEPALQDIEGRSLAWGCVRQEADGRFRCWYQSTLQDNVHEMVDAEVWGRGTDYGFYPERHPAACREWQTSILSYAESEDGLHWHRPELGLFEWRGSKQNNIVLDCRRAAEQFGGAITNLDTISVLIDEDAPASERYKLICHWETLHIHDNQVSKLDRPEEDMQRFREPRNKYLVTSPDGIRWNSPLIFVKGCAGGGDYSGVTRDHRNGRWWFNDRAPVGMPGVGFRSAGLCSSADLLDWPENVEQIVHPGQYEDWGRRYQHHGMTPFNYGDQDLGYLELSIQGAPVAMVLLSHRDGQRWQRAHGDGALLEVGPRGSYDDRVLNVMRNPPMVVGDELIIPYNGRTVDTLGYDHFRGRQIGSLGLARMRLDGFAGFEVDPLAVYRHGTAAVIQTQPVEVSAAGVQVNIEGHNGSARAALLDEGGRAIEGYGLTDCLPIAEDEVRATVRWKEKQGVSELQGRRVILMLQMVSGTVWSFRL